MEEKPLRVTPLRSVRVMPGLLISRKDRNHMVANTFLKVLHVCLGLHIIVMIAGFHISQEIYAIDVLTALKSSLKQRRKHVLRSVTTVWRPGFTHRVNSLWE